MVTSSLTGDINSIAHPTTPYDQTVRVLTSSQTTPVEIGRRDTVLGTEIIETVGPATIRIGENQSQTFFVQAGTVNRNTLTRIQRDLATTTTDTYTTTQLVVVSFAPGISSGRPPGGTGGSSLTISTRRVPVLAISSAVAVKELALTRIVGTFQGVRFDLSLPVPYDPANPDIQLPSLRRDPRSWEPPERRSLAS